MPSPCSPSAPPPDSASTRSWAASGRACSRFALPHPSEPATSPCPDPDARRRTLALSLLPRVGIATYHDLVARFGSAPHAFDATADPTARAAALAAADQALSNAQRCGACVLLPDDPDYPARLLDLDHIAADQRLSPPVLFAIGNLAMLRTPLVSIVGTRRATPYGERVTATIASALARAGAAIVSGMARGIDGAAHTAALSATGATIAVLGTGVDVAYPTAHRALRERIAATGLLLSEELPGDRANGGSFPKRNRIIAALADVTLVTEAPVRSGALITARYALELGRTVAAVPGPIDSPQSAGANALLRDGAYAIAGIDDALGLIHATAPAPAAPNFTDAHERAVWDALGQGCADIDSLSARARLPARACLAAVTALEIRGVIECALTGDIRRK